VSDDRGGVYRVFLSSTAEDLAAHRRLVLDALARLDDVKLVNQESFGARAAASTVEECRRLVKQSDIVVVVVAHRYGWVPTIDEGGDHERSITALEVEAAGSKPVLRFLVADDYDWPYGTEQDALTDADADANEVKRRVRLLVEFRDHLQTGMVDWFTTAENLASRVTTAVSNEIMRLVREPERIAVGMRHIAEKIEQKPDTDTLFRWQQPKEAQEQPIAPLLVKGIAHRTRQSGVSIPLVEFFHEWREEDTAAPLVAVVDFPLDIVDSIGRLAGGAGYGYCGTPLDLLDLPFAEINSRLQRFTADRDVQMLFIDCSNAALENVAQAGRHAPVHELLRNFLQHLFRACASTGVRCATFIPRFLTTRPYDATLPDTPFACETAPLFDKCHARRVQWLQTTTKVRRIGRPLDRLLSVNSDSAIRLVADFFSTQGISGTLEVTPANPGSLNILVGLADLLARSRCYELAFRLERYCRTLSAARDLVISANLHPKGTRTGESWVVGLLHNAADLPPTLDRAALLSAPGGGKTTLLRQIDVAATVPEPDRSAPTVTLRIKRSRHDQAGIAELLIDKLRRESQDDGRTFRVHQTLAEILPKLRLGDIFASRIQLLLDTDGVLRAHDIKSLDAQLVDAVGPPETTGYLLSVTNDTPPAERPVPCIELRRLTTAQIEHAFRGNAERFREFLDLERFVPEFSNLLRSPFLLGALTRQPAGDGLSIGRALGHVVAARITGLPRRDEIYRNLTRTAPSASLEHVGELDPDPDWLAEATDTKLVVRAKGTVHVRFENTLIREYFLAQAIVDAGGPGVATTPASRLVELNLDAESQRRVSALCIDLLERSDVASFVRELAGTDAVLAHTAALYASWHDGGLTPEARSTADAVLQLAATRPAPATLLTALGPADPRLAPSRPRESMVATIADEPSGLKIARYPTTNWEFWAFVRDGGYTRSEFWSDEGRRWHAMAGRPRQPQTWSHPERTAPNLPVRGVSFFEAEAYCRWLSAQDSAVRFWLPSAAVWDLVAHGEQQPLWSTIVDSGRATVAVLSKSSGPDGNLTDADSELLMRIGRTTASLGSQAMQQYSGAASQNSFAPIGTGSPNALGVYDLYGLCWQWCATAVDGSDIEPFWSSTRRRPLMMPLLVKGGTAGEQNLPAVWSLIGSWFMPQIQYDGIGFRTVSLDV
jgi:formylglycine-generating enzyme required for sulfatase activity